MPDKSELYSLVPAEARGLSIELIDDLAPVVERLRQIMPPKLLWSLFASSPSETGGKIVFPYCRVDSDLIVYPSSTGLQLHNLTSQG